MSQADELLDSLTKALTEEGASSNSLPYFDGEFIIDHHSIGGLLNEMGYVIVVDYENRVISIQ